jgi:hypothetical protein
VVTLDRDEATGPNPGVDDGRRKPPPGRRHDALPKGF